MGECRHPFEIPSLLQPEIVEGGHVQSGAVKICRVIFNTPMNTDIVPSGDSIETFVNTILIPTGSINWQGTRTLDWGITDIQPVTTIEVFMGPGTIPPVSADGVQIGFIGPDDLNFPIPPVQ